MRKRTTRHGFSLLEVLVTVAVIGIGLISAIQCLGYAFLVNMRANRVAQATTEVHNFLEEWRSNGLAWDAGTPTTGSEALNDSTFPDGRLEYTLSDYTAPSNPSLPLKQVTVRLSWTGRAQQRESVRQSTVISNRTRHIGH